MVSFPQFASQPSSVSMLRYSSSIIASAPVPAWRDWPIENTVFDVTFNTRGISQAILRNKDGVKRYSESQNGRLNDPDLAIYALRTVQLSEITMAAVSCCVGSLSQQAQCIAKIEGGQGDSTSSSENKRVTK